MLVKRTIYVDNMRGKGAIKTYIEGLMKSAEMRILLGSEIPILIVTNVTTAAIFDRPCVAWILKKIIINCPQSRTSKNLKRKSQ